MSTDVQVQNGLLPSGFCPSDYQTLLNGFSAVQYVSLDLVSSIVASTTPPADHTVAWLQLDANGAPVRLYYFAQGAWLSLHPLPSGFTMLWNQPIPNFQTFDGGDNNSAPFTEISGQMWQLMAGTLDGTVPATQDVMNGKFPVGVGSFTNSGNVAVTGVVTSTGIAGEDAHKLVLEELAPHAHIPVVGGGGFFQVRTSASTGLPASGSGGTINDVSITAPAGGDPATGTPPTAAKGHVTLPPFYGVYFLQRTSRQFYLVPA